MGVYLLALIILLTPFVVIGVIIHFATAGNRANRARERAQQGYTQGYTQPQQCYTQQAAPVQRTAAENAYINNNGVTAANAHRNVHGNNSWS